MGATLNISIGMLTLHKLVENEWETKGGASLLQSPSSKRTHVLRIHTCRVNHVYVYIPRTLLS